VHETISLDGAIVYLFPYWAALIYMLRGWGLPICPFGGAR